MPRTSKTSDGAASSSAAGGGEETTDGVKKRQKLTVQDKDQLRELKRRFSQRARTCTPWPRRTG